MGVEKGLRLRLQGVLARLLTSALPGAQTRLRRFFLRFQARLSLAGSAQIDEIGQFVRSEPPLNSRALPWQQEPVNAVKIRCA